MVFGLEHGMYLMAGLPLAAATAPLLLELLLVTPASMMPHKRRRQASKYLPSGRLVAVVPSHNEEAAIGRCVQSIAASAGGAHDILVIAHNCVDGTAERARAEGAMVSELNDPEMRGKGNALEHGFGLAFGTLGADAVLIVDADSTVSEDLVAIVRRRLETAQAVQCRYQCGSTGEPKSRLRALAFFCMNVIRPLGRERLGLSCGIFGNGFGFRREVLERVPYAAHSIVEDLEFHLSLIAAGIRCEFVEEVRVWAEVPEMGKAASTQSARWEGGRLHMLRAHGAALLAQVLRGRGALLEPLLDLAGLPLAMETLCLAVLLALPVHALRMYAAAGFAILGLHLAVAIYVGDDPGANLAAVMQIPLYILSKVGMLPAILRMTRRRADWVRTSRARPSK